MSTPAITRHPPADSRIRGAWLRASGRHLTRWPAEAFETSPTDCYQVGEEFWIWQSGVGGIAFSTARSEIAAFPDPSVDPSWFDHLVTRSWLPAVYQTWGRQVLHASAVVEASSGRVVVFSGPSGAGKSTLAYALGARPGWRQIADDTLAFGVEGESVTLHPMQNDARLRPATAAHFGRVADPVLGLAWPAERLTPVAIFCLEPNEPGSQPASTRLPPADAYRRLLQQAHAFTLEVRTHNARLMRDYLALTAGVPAFAFTYPRDFAVIDHALETLEAVVATLRTPPARRT